MRKFGYFVAMGMIVMVSSGCAPSLKLNRVKPAEINLSQYKKVAVGEFGGRGGQETGMILTQALFDSGRFEVVDREHLYVILKEQNLSMSDAFDPSSSVRIGKMIGSAAMIFGQVTRRDYDEKHSSSKATCTDGNGNKYICMSYRTEGLWNLNLQFKLVDSSTGRILATKMIQKKDDKSVSATNERPSIDWDRDSVFEELQRAAVQDFMKMIAPYTEQVQVKIFTDKTLPELERGLQYAQRGDWGSAVEQFRTACNTADNNPAIKAKVRARAHYDLGIALGYSGIDYTQAISELQKAADINAESEYFSEMEKIKQFRSDDEKLKEQGVHPNGISRVCTILVVS